MQDLASLTQELLRERDEMLQRTRAPMYLVKGDEADIAVLSRLKEDAVWLAQEAHAKILEIDAALARIDRGIYGACARCTTPIPDERLTAMPLTLYCVGCQSYLERPYRK